MKATKLPSGKWRARAYNKYTKKQVSFTAATRQDALRMATSYEASTSGKEAITVDQVCELYIRNRSKVLSPNTIRDYQCSRSYHIDGIKNRSIPSLNDTAMQAWVNDLAEDLSPKSVKNVYGFVSAAIKSYMPSKVFNVKLPAKVKPQLNIPSEAQMREVFDRIKGMDIEVPVKMAFYCCLRRGEVAGLLRHPECLGTDSVTVRYNIVKSGNVWIEKQPKTYYSYRTVPCPPELIEQIKNAPRLNPGEITDKWIKLKTGFRFHDLRHAAASFMLSAGIPIIDVEKFGGWQHGSSVLQSIYTHNIEESLRRSADIWQKKLQTLEK